MKNVFFVMKPNGKQLSGASDEVDGWRKFLPVLDSVRPLEKLEDALLKRRVGRQEGRLSSK